MWIYVFLTLWCLINLTLFNSLSNLRAYTFQTGLVDTETPPVQKQHIMSSLANASCPRPWKTKEGMGSQTYWLLKASAFKKRINESLWVHQGHDRNKKWPWLWTWQCLFQVPGPSARWHEYINSHLASQSSCPPPSPSTFIKSKVSMKNNFKKGQPIANSALLRYTT